MKTLFSFVLFVILSAQVWSHPKNNVPTNVKSSFAEKYKNATDVDWEKDKDEEGSNWEVEYVINGKEHSSLFDNNGVWLQTEMQIKIAELPKLVTDIITKKYKGYKTEEAENFESKKGKFYLVTISKGEKSLELTITKDAEIVKQEVEEKD